VLPLALWFVAGSGRRREFVMCAAFKVMVFYRVGETEGIGDLCRSWRYGSLQKGEEAEGNLNVCCS